MLVPGGGDLAIFVLNNVNTGGKEEWVIHQAAAASAAVVAGSIWRPRYSHISLFLKLF